MTGQKSPWPTRWLMTDPRIGELAAAIDALPGDAGVVVRHDHLPREERLGIARLVLARRLVLAMAGDVALAREAGAALVHRPTRDSGDLPFSMPVHNEDEAAAALGAALVFVSPVYATASHPGGVPLGPESAAGLAARAKVPAIALGGVDERRFERDLRPRGFHGWAGIDAWRRR